MSNLTKFAPSGKDVTQHTVSERTRKRQEPTVSESTKQAYGKAWKYFAQWCKENGYNSLPASPATVCEYITAICDDLKFNTIKKRITAIGQFHEYANVENPRKSKLVRQDLKNLKRKKRKKEDERIIQKNALINRHMKEIVPHLSDNIKDLRDKALLLIGYCGAFRRSELVNIDYEDLEFEVDGVWIYLGSSKTDQHGKGAWVGIPTGTETEGETDLLPVQALKEWIQKAGIQSGPIFRAVDRHGNVYDRRISGMTVARTVKKYVKLIGMNPANYSGHSLRAGAVTQAKLNGASNSQIMNHTRHKKLEQVEEYDRRAKRLEDALQLT